MPPPCPHGRQRYFCKECGGGGICEHGRRRSQCKECSPHNFCACGKRFQRCRAGCKKPEKPIELSTSTKKRKQVVPKREGKLSKACE